jgi:DNA-binding SARP family transcriptional activator/predicted ATPase
MFVEHDFIVAGKRSGNDPGAPIRDHMNKGLCIRLLGEVAIAVEGSQVTELPSRTAEALLIYLVCHQRPFARELLADLLWDDRPQQQALANLRSILSSLRRIFGSYVIITRQTIAFNHDSDYFLDIAQFERLLETERLETGDYATTRLQDYPTTRLQDAVTLYRGDFLSGFYLRSSRGFEEWTAVQRERLQRRAILALRQLVNHALQCGQYQAGIRDAGHWLRLDPFNEEAHRQMMLLQARAGQPNAALRHYHACRQLLADELGVEPAPLTSALYLRIRTTRATAPPNLPPVTTPFVGREAELADLIDHLADPGCRLVTLLGPGGVGKTRLALQAVRQIAAERPGLFLHGMRFVSLTAIVDGSRPTADGSRPTTPTSFLIALADAWPIPGYNAADPLDDIINFLREKESLLLLDNFEHLLEAADALAIILEQAPLVRLLVTSQKRLNLGEEWVFDLEGLPYPDEEVVDVADSFPAVQLFRQQARRLCRSFQPTAADYQAMARICRIVDGVPLGIELAAAAVRRHPCPQIADQLTRRLDFLADAPRNAPPRHQSLRAVFEYSWQLLTTAEQTAVCQLSVFRTPFRVETAVAITQTTPATLHALTDASFLRLTTGPDAVARLEMHSLARQFAADELAARPAAERETRNRHGRYYAQFLHDQRARLPGGQQKEAMTAVNAEIEDVRAAWEWIVSQGRWSDLDLALDGLYWFYWLRNWLPEGEAALSQAAAALAQSDEMDELLLARIQARQAEFCYWLSQYEAAQTLFTASLPMLHAHQAWSDLAWALNAQGTMAYFRGEFSAAGQHLQLALAYSRQTDDRAGMAYAMNNLGNVACEDQANYAAAVRLYQESLAIYRELGDLMGQSKCLINLGCSAQVQGDVAEARRLYQEGINICRAMDNRVALAVALNNLGQLEADQGAFAAGETYLLEGLEIKREIGERRSIVFALKQLGAVARQTGRLKQAQVYLDEALAMSRELGTAVLMADVLTAAARLYAAQNQPNRALELLAIIRVSALNDQELMNQVDKLWPEIASQVTPDTAVVCRRRGEEMGLEGVVTAVLNDFRAG